MMMIYNDVYSGYECNDIIDSIENAEMIWCTFVHKYVFIFVDMMIIYTNILSYISACLLCILSIVDERGTNTQIYFN